MSTFFCSDLARSEGDQLFGTVKPIRLYIALEYWAAWNRKAIQSELLQPEVGEFVTRIRAELPDSRFLLVRQPESKHRKPSCFIAVLRETGSEVHHFTLDDDRDILSLDVAAVLAGTSSRTKWAAPMFLVCNHAKHDKCCAKYGNPVLDAVRQHAPNEVWESSHVGGCRFAANMICLPHGLMYGRLSPEDAVNVISAHKEGALLLPNLRGRACFPRHVQAAEYFARCETGIVSIDGLRFIASTSAGGNGWTTEFQLAGSATRFAVEHTASQSAVSRLLSCSDITPQTIWSNHLSSIRKYEQGETRVSSKSFGTFSGLGHDKLAGRCRS